MERKFVEITKEKAKELYCKCEKVYVSTSRRSNWKIPESREYSSHAPAEELFNRGIPKYEGEVKFFIAQS